MKIRILIFTLLCYHLNFGQSLNKEITDQGNPFLLGKINKEGLTSTNYNAWFTKEFDNYNPKKEVVQKGANDLKDYTITMFMGTWCGDSKRQVPRFYKVLEASNYPMEQLTAVAVSRKPDMHKQSPGHEEKGLNIHRVPTFIFYKNGVEVNRIVESPVASLEEDIQSILNNNYESNYKVVTKVNKMLQEFGAKKFNEKVKKQIPVLKEQVTSLYELNTYANILMSTNRIEEAIEILKLNTKLFPKEPKTYINLANKLARSGNTKKAIKALKKALELNPENKQAQKSIEVLRSKL